MKVGLYVVEADLYGPPREERIMLWTLIVLLLLFWVLGFAFDVAGGIIYILLVVAAVVFIVNLISGRRRVL